MLTKTAFFSPPFQNLEKLKALHLRCRRRHSLALEDAHTHKSCSIFLLFSCCFILENGNFSLEKMF